MAHLTTKQIKQLIEIDNAGPGIRAEVQALITRLTSGGVGIKTDDPRIAQVKRLYDKGFGGEMSFQQYLDSIPAIDEELLNDDDRFPLLALVDSRIGIVQTCELLGIDFGVSDQTFEDFDPKKAHAEQVYWMRAQDGKKNKGKSARDCRSEFVSDELGLTVHEGLALFAQSPETFRNWGMNLTGSVRRDVRRDCAACLYWFHVRPELCGGSDGHGLPYFGSGSRRK